MTAFELKRGRRAKSAGRDSEFLTKYEIGKIISSGMIGIVYVCRTRPCEPGKRFKHLVVAKRMYKPKIEEKKLETSVILEIQILLQVHNVKGCCQLVDLIDSS